MRALNSSAAATTTCHSEAGRLRQQVSRRRVDTDSAQRLLNEVITLNRLLQERGAGVGLDCCRDIAGPAAVARASP
jgi:hypothetical protein